MSRLTIAFSSVVLTGLLGCAVDAQQSVTDVGTPPENLNRTAMCFDLQETYCRHYADDCSAIDRGACDRIMTQSFCSNDGVTAACVEALTRDGAACDEAPAECAEVFDPKPAQWRCEELAESICQRQAECKIQPRGDCLEMLAEVWPCSQAIGINHNFDECRTRTESIPCGSISSDGLKTLPEGCEDVILVSAESTDAYWP